MIELRMTDRRVLVQMDIQTEHTMPSGVIAVESYDPGVIGTVIAVGPQVRDVQPEDVVLFPPGAGQELEMEGQPFLILDEDEVIARWDSEQNPI